ncbi:MAG: transposase [Gammaproteobacteria bacterium]|nr:transposase [Gammaproteobacteria bacterium]
MVRYRRNRVAGGTYFFTVTLNDRQSRRLVDEIDHLGSAIRSVKRERPFRIDALVILPEHLHAIWTLPPDDDDYVSRWRMIKARFSRALMKGGAVVRCNDRGEYDLWRRRYWEHTIRDEADLRHHVDYVHYNPVKHGWVRRVDQWPYSTFHRYVRNGAYPKDWAGGDRACDDREYGE